MTEEEARLNEFSAVEWYDVARVFRPELSWDEFMTDWEEFQLLKAEHARKASQQ
jgi:hypothetical protein